MDRRTFLGGAVASLAMPQVLNQLPVAIDLTAIERGRVLRAANQYLLEPPMTLTSYRGNRSAGGPHDYFSEADYFWPDPKNPGGPYVNRDGESNPANFNDHRLALIRMSVQVPALTAAWVITGQKKYAAKAAEHVIAWFVKTETLMNPNLEYAQAVHGRSTGRNYGIIDTVHLAEVAQSVLVLAPSSALSSNDRATVLAWFARYTDWLTQSERGHQERDTKNNHSTTWLLQVAAFARLTNNTSLAADCRARFKTVIVPQQIAPDGSFPLELARTKPYSYSLFNLDAMATCCLILSTSSDNLWTYTTADSRGVAQAIRFLYPFIRDKSSWPYLHDVEYFADLPVRQPSLLFGGEALRQPAWVNLWRSLDADPVSPEVIRNFPIRQPLLWYQTPT